VTALRVEDLRCHFGPVRALDGVTLALEPGELFAVIGPSGCGKTTLLRVITGLETPGSGRVLVDDVEVTSRPPERRGMALVFQNYALFPHLTVTENVAFGLRYADVPRSQRRPRAQGFLERVGLAGLGDRLPAELSGGQQQRVALARSLAVRPRILLLDEPLSNLDARLRETTRLELRELLKEHGVTSLYVTHDQEEAMALGDRVAVMQEGRVVQCAPPGELYRRPESAFVARFVCRATVLKALVEGIPDGGDSYLVRAGSLLVAAEPGCLQPRPAVGDPVLLAVRPELCELCPDGAPGVITRRAWLGPVVQYQVQLEDGIVLEALAAGSVQVPAPGTSVAVRVRPHQAVLVAP
jgi:ABC-type Fe3+/spermidine/putrescine transport system ATPase subunit